MKPIVDIENRSINNMIASDMDYVDKSLATIRKMAENCESIQVSQHRGIVRDEDKSSGKFIYAPDGEYTFTFKLSGVYFKKRYA